MSSTPSARLEVAKEIMLKAMDIMRYNFGHDISSEKFNEQYAKEIDKLFKSIYKTVKEAEQQ